MFISFVTSFQYDCIVKIYSNSTSCIGVFVSEDVMITTQRCINTYIKINNITISDYKASNRSKEGYDITYVRFNDFKHKCSSYFKIHPDVFNLEYPISVRKCGTSCINVTINKSYGNKFYVDYSLNPNSTLIQSKGELGEPIVSEDVIYGITSEIFEEFVLAEKINRDDFDKWNKTITILDIVLDILIDLLFIIVLIAVILHVYEIITICVKILT